MDPGVNLILAKSPLCTNWEPLILIVISICVYRRRVFSILYRGSQ